MQSSEPSAQPGEQPDSKPILIAQINAYVCARLGDTMIPNNRPASVRPRQIVSYLAHTVWDYSLPRIAIFFRPLSGRPQDHTTVLHAVRRIAALRKADLELDVFLREAIEAIPLMTPEQVRAATPKRRSGLIDPNYYLRLTREDHEAIGELVMRRIGPRIASYLNRNRADQEAC